MIAQLGIATFGVLAIWLSQSQSYEARKWASVAGFMSLPFGYWAAYQADYWGVMALNVACTVAWARGFHTYWMAKGRGEPDHLGLELLRADRRGLSDRCPRVVAVVDFVRRDVPAAVPSPEG